MGICIHERIEQFQHYPFFYNYPRAFLTENEKKREVFVQYFLHLYYILLQQIPIVILFQHLHLVDGDAVETHEAFALGISSSMSTALMFSMFAKQISSLMEV